MKIAVSADLHLKAKNDTPQRWKACQNILLDISKKGIKRIIIAGDLFDKSLHNYSEFDNLAFQYRDIIFHIIPGNHDSIIEQKVFTSPNIRVYNNPEINFMDANIPFLFLPYKPEVSMGEVIAPYLEKLSPNKWILVSHGDWGESIRVPNLAEPGIYMPLTKKDLEEYKPALTLLGHIHKPWDDSNYKVYYPGSPCGLDITETGRRRYLLLNAETLEVESVKVDSEVIYFDETIVVYPMENEEQHIKNEIHKIKKKWSLSPEEKLKTKIRIKVKGYSSNKKRLKKIFDEEFKDYSFYGDEGVDVSEVSSSDKYELSKIYEKVFEKINRESWEEKGGEPTKNEILSKVIQKIYSIG